MMVLVIGGSGSGKSACAEKLAVSLSHGEEYGALSESMKKYYLATMRVYDSEGRRKVERHRILRSGKGFLTIEQPINIDRALEKMEAGRRTALLECVSNLTANEMFSEGHPNSEISVAEKIVRDIERIRENTAHLVVVSNNVFEDGIIYDETTMSYIRAMGSINRELAVMADQVVEVVVGIPVAVKRLSDVGEAV